jgi:nicotinate-nucleotide adenylyltransferase
MTRTGAPKDSYTHGRTLGSAEGARSQAKPSEIAKTGVFGGTFNPIHVGHLRAAEEVAEWLGLERVVFVPSARPPHKNEQDGDPIAPADLRLAWARAATADNPRFEVDPLEIERGGQSFTVETLRTIGARVAPELPVFMIGCDAFVAMGTWREPETLFTLANFAVTTRPPVARASLADWLPKCVRDEIELAPDGLSGRHRSAGSSVQLLEIAALEVSASDIRRRLREGRSVRYLLPESMRAAVEESGVYTRS